MDSTHSLAGLTLLAVCLAAIPVPSAGQAPAPASPDESATTPSETLPVAQPVAPAPLPPVATPVQPSTTRLPGGASVSEEMAISRVIENVRPERVQVYPDDPESAWWEINPRYAFARAQREQKPLLLLFTGTWNAQAMSLSEEVFATKSFNEYVKENLIICYLNYPRNITDAPDSMRFVKEKFKVRGYPNVLLFNPTGDVEKGIRGYRSGRPVDYFHKLKAACYPILQSIDERKAALLRYGYRDWSNYLGKVIFAKFLERDDSRTVLQDVAGEKWLIKINDLSPDDQRMVESFPAKEKVTHPSLEE